ncbi:MAG: hypothetical protein H6842_07120 [Rhodospirillaceae bacterium]|nr:hypothetical protein [Rhodospirillaceae bacterium]
MFRGEDEAAREIYLANRGLEIQGSVWEDVVREDFRLLREAGLDHPLMAEIEAAFDGDAP